MSNPNELRNQVAGLKVLVAQLLQFARHREPEFDSIVIRISERLEAISEIGRDERFRIQMLSQQLSLDVEEANRRVQQSESKQYRLECELADLQEQLEECCFRLGLTTEEVLEKDEVIRKLSEELELANCKLFYAEIERTRNRRLAPEELFCLGCDLPYCEWDGRRYVCLKCGRANGDLE